MAVNQPATHHLLAARRITIAERVDAGASLSRISDADVVRSTKSAPFDEPNSPDSEQLTLNKTRNIARPG
jgi:hypothetical protein